MTVDLRWLTASEDEVAAAMAAQRSGSRPGWVPTKRQLLVHVNNCLILWYLCIGFMVIGVRVDGIQDGRVTGTDVRDLVIVVLVLAVWLAGTVWLRRWAKRPPSPRARLAEWRQSLTALANGYESRPSDGPTFRSLITAGNRRAREYPRFVAHGIEFGNIVHGSARSAGWHYLAVRLPAPLPHLILDATTNNGLRSDLPTGVDRGQRISLEGDFDRWFQVYAPERYGVDARYVLTPDVMAALVGTAAYYNVEIVDDHLVFFSQPTADFTAPAPWLAVAAILDDPARRLAATAARYRDERVPGQEAERVLADARLALENDAVWTRRETIIGADGRRLSLRGRNTGVWPILGLIGWFLTLTFLYAVPGIFAFAGFMSIVDGR